MSIILNPPLSTLERLEADGYIEGPPGHVHPATIAIDKAACHRSRCARCKKRGMACRMLRKGPRYAVVAVCESCGHQEEV